MKIFFPPKSIQIRCFGSTDPHYCRSNSSLLCFTFLYFLLTCSAATVYPFALELLVFTLLNQPGHWCYFVLFLVPRWYFLQVRAPISLVATIHRFQNTDGRTTNWSQVNKPFSSKLAGLRPQLLSLSLLPSALRAVANFCHGDSEASEIHAPEWTNARFGCLAGEI